MAFLDASRLLTLILRARRSWTPAPTTSRSPTPSLDSQVRSREELSDDQTFGHLCQLSSFLRWVCLRHSDRPLLYLLQRFGQAHSSQISIFPSLPPHPARLLHRSRLRASQPVRPVRSSRDARVPSLGRGAHLLGEQTARRGLGPDGVRRGESRQGMQGGAMGVSRCG